MPAGYISYEKYRNIALTPLGERYGKFLVWRDQTLKAFLRMLNAPVGVDDQVEGMEHYITPKTMSLIRNLISYFTAHPEALNGYRALHHLEGYPDSEELGDLRAWDFRHSMDSEADDQGC